MQNMNLFLGSTSKFYRNFACFYYKVLSVYVADLHTTVSTYLKLYKEKLNKKENAHQLRNRALLMKKFGRARFFLRPLRTSAARSSFGLGIFTKRLQRGT